MNKIQLIKSRLTQFIIAALAIANINSALAEERPNIIVFYADDQGWADSSLPMLEGDESTKSDFYQTPNMERMAEEGMVFSRAYAPSPVCTPSRTSVQFGKTPARLQYTVVHDILAINRNVKCKDEKSLHQMIKAADPDYVTANFGKWGLSVWTEPGYDFDEGNTNNIDGDWKVRNEERYPDNDPKGIFTLTDKASGFITQCTKEDKPFFLQLSHYAVHVDTYARPETIEKYKNLPRGSKCTDADYDTPVTLPQNGWIMSYAAMLEDMDTGLGLLLDTLEALGIADNTYFIYTSDNGGGFRGNAPLKGGKAMLWEGGIRIPTVVTGPGVKKGYCDTPIAQWDIYPTVNEILGGAPLDASYDGGSMLSLFENGNEGTIERGVDELYFHYPWYGGTMPASVVIDGKYKLIMNLHTRESRLFDVSVDLGEENDLSESLPCKKIELLNKLEGYLESVNAEDLDDMFDARLKELEGRIEQARQEGNQTSLESNLNQYEHISGARENTAWRW